jgi:putative transposase
MKYTRPDYPASTGVGMHYGFRLPKGMARIATEQRTLSREARWRLAILTYSQTHSVAATCRHYGIARSTYYRWWHRIRMGHLAALETRSSRPYRCRTRSWTTSQAIAVRELRRQHPGMGKAKLAVLLRQQNLSLSVSMVGRILAHLHASGQLAEPRSRTAWRPHSRHARPYAVRKPKDYAVDEPGALIQADTMVLHPLPGMTRYHFTAIDVVSRYSVADVRSVATASAARDFLTQLIDRFPLPIRAIQVDGGSEFMAEFEAACHEREIRLFTLPPRSPKLNGRVERVNRTYRNEFYEHYTGDLDLPSLQAALRTFEQTYNRHRPHQALGYRTPAAVLDSWLGSPL